MGAVTRTAGELLITAGVLLLLFVAWQLWWTDVGAGRAEHAAASQLSRAWPEAARDPVARPAAGADPPVPAEPAHASAFAIVHVPRFGDGWSVAAEQGVDTDGVLDDGVLGHYPGTAMVGGVGNFALAGHRVTYGKPLNRIADLQVGDPLVVETGDAWYVYRVTGHEIVTPDRVDVIAPVPGDPDAVPTERTITLTACHPQFSARYRYVVHGVMESWRPRSAGAPAALGGGVQASGQVPGRGSAGGA